MKKKTIVTVQSYKHDGSLHRVWKKNWLVEAKESRIILFNPRSRVIEGDGRYWRPREDSLHFFYKDRWFNIMAMFRKAGVYYYANIASPVLWDDEALKYVDYDLDVKVFPDGTYKVLDMQEYERHEKRMEYPEELTVILEKELETLKTMVENREGPFRKGLCETYYERLKEGSHEGSKN